jgi:hypothetical protein
VIAYKIWTRNALHFAIPAISTYSELKLTNKHSYSLPLYSLNRRQTKFNNTYSTRWLFFRLPIYYVTPRMTNDSAASVLCILAQHARRHGLTGRTVVFIRATDYKRYAVESRGYNFTKITCRIWRILYSGAETQEKIMTSVSSWQHDLCCMAASSINTMLKNVEVNDHKNKQFNQEMITCGLLIQLEVRKKLHNHIFHLN